MFMAKGWGPTVEREGGVICELPRNAAPKAAPPRQRRETDIEPLLPRPVRATRRERMRYLVTLVAAKHGIRIADIMSESRADKVVLAKFESAYRVKRAYRRLSWPQVGRFFDIDHTTALYRASRFADLTGKPQLSSYKRKRK
jgi:hypothetical protein